MKKSFQIGNRLILLWLSFFLPVTTVQAEDLQIEPSVPVLEVGQSMDLLVSRASGIVTWTAANGQIESTGTLVTYVAPEKTGTDVVTVFDGNGNIGTVQITVMPAGNRAAILIHSNVQGNGYNQQQTVDFMATYAYRSLQARNYDDDEIYLLSYKPNLDINNDSQADSVVDAPVNLTAFQNGMVARDLTVADGCD
jgi:hypothetical protein